MTYMNMAAIQSNSQLRQRLIACAAEQNVEQPYSTWVESKSWNFATQPEWADAWASAIASHPEPTYDPGSDEGVITDGMILSATQGLNSN